MRLSHFVMLKFGSEAFAGEARVLINGTGRTRQQAIERIFEKLPEVERVTIMPRRDVPADSKRIFVLETKGDIPTKDDLIEALGKAGEGIPRALGGGNQGRVSRIGLSTPGAEVFPPLRKIFYDD